MLKEKLSREKRLKLINQQLSHSLSPTSGLGPVKMTNMNKINTADLSVIPIYLKSPTPPFRQGCGTVNAEEFKIQTCFISHPPGDRPELLFWEL